MIELTLAAAMHLRSMLRAQGVVGAPGVRLRAHAGGPAGPPGDPRLEILIEDRPEAGDAVTESRGIRFYLDPAVASLVGRGVLDLVGGDFVVRAEGS